MSKSLMVVATKYILEVPIPGGSGAYKKDGQKKLIHTKIVQRAYVESRNEDINNELYIIDEAATKKVYALKDSKKKASTKPMTLADIIGGKEKVSVKVINEVKEVKEFVLTENRNLSSVKEPLFNEDTDIEVLKAYCDENSIKYHHKAGVGKLLELIG